jgi:hypothetical protein
VKDIQRQLFRGFAVARNSHHQGKDDAMRALVKGMQRKRIARGDGLDEGEPVLLLDQDLPLAGIKNIPECCRRRGRILFDRFACSQGRNCAIV